MPRTLLFLMILTLGWSCTDNLVVSQYQSTTRGSWNKDDIIAFTFSEIDTLEHYNVFLNVRNDESYPFSNLFLITELDFPNGQTVRDTLEYEMALPDGQWLGKGFGSIKENKLWYKENIVFPVNGVYTLSISHAMRRNGSVEGIAELPGITDVGFEIEKRN
ncbi:gliding motility lipoprotein GldH [Poritiphilus flavus]|uniref:Gliding motility lipoprotein GldH n=1 Tax=Poritiphilus flavus TaxID=2697053 RepID=A0A6L9E803_9FLAO|nr:gliding motility lipoprotein GldH [Poritiphilus flavus]NAS10915.1 gliding motility lipoprotein GldH [Poritiphilus flavus]